MRALRTSLFPFGFAAALVGSASAQIGFNAPAVVPTGARAGGQILADLDGDGDRDLAVATEGNCNQDLIELYRNVSGNFSAEGSVFLANGSSPTGLAAADFDGDGDVDIVCGASDNAVVAQNSVVLFRNGGVGVFAGPFTFATGGLDTGDVFVADLDGDGDRDVVAANQGSGNLSVMANMGGVLGAATLVAIGIEPSEVVGADVDGNGSPDLAVTLRRAANVCVLDNQASFGVGSNYCGANVNSTGVAARSAATGSASVAANNLGLVCTQMPLNAAGYFLTSTTQGFSANPGGSAGNICLGGALGRYSLLTMNSGATGSIIVPVNLGAIPTPTGPVAGAVGQTWNFQCWFRDSVGDATSNFSNGLSVTLN